jgi:hypothetical protein
VVGGEQVGEAQRATLYRRQIAGIGRLLERTHQTLGKAVIDGALVAH